MATYAKHPFPLQQVILSLSYEYTNKDLDIQSINQIRVSSLYCLEAALHISYHSVVNIE